MKNKNQVKESSLVIPKPLAPENPDIAISEFFYTEKISVIDYKKEFKDYFKSLNEEWIKKFFVLEDDDIKLLNYPEENILNKGGVIKFAKLNNEIIGTCALLKISNNVYELAKMAVSPKAQGKKIGFYLAKEIISEAKKLGAKKVVLLSNKKLQSAINLYLKLGFKEIKNSETDSSYKRVDIVMELIL